jgi:uncharacterized protein (TIGR03067 family)
MNKSFWALGLLVPLLIAAGKEKTDAARDELRRFEGTWKLVSAESKGQPAPEDVVKALQWDIKDNRVTVRGTEGKQVKLTMQLDTTQKPRAMDLTNSARKETMQGIYELTKDRMKVCLGAPGEKRPTQFATKEDLKVVLLVFKRQKK